MRNVALDAVQTISAAVSQNLFVIG
jgi:hypothetical protein